MLRRLVGAVVVAAGVALGASVIPAPALAKPAQTPAKEAETFDRVIFLSGRTVEGQILEQTTDEIVMLVTIGTLKTKTRYRASDILKIEENIAVEGGGEAAEAEDDESEEKTWDPDAAVIYLVDFEGTFGSDISETPLRKLSEAIDESFDDLVKRKNQNNETVWVVDPEVRDRHIVVVKMDCGSDPRQSMNAIFRAEQIGPYLEEAMQEKGRRIVFWIESATDGAAFLPWLSQEIYFTSEGRMAFSQDLEDFSSGDDIVDEKLISARLGHYHGFALDGGYDLGPDIIDAMARSRYWLSYQMVGGKPKLSRRPYTSEMEEDGWVLLTDNGKGENEDKDKKAWRNFNDRLVLTARTAQILNISKGTVDSIDHLAQALGVHRNYRVIEDEGSEFFEKWIAQKEAAFRKINTRPSRERGPLGELWVEFQEIKIEGDYFDQQKARKRQIGVLREIQRTLRRFAEVWDPSGRFISQVETQIETIRKDIQLAKAAARATITGER